MVPVMFGTIVIAVIAMCVKSNRPAGAIYTAEFAPVPVRMVKPALEILAGIPTVVYGFFAALTAAPFFAPSARHLA